MEKFFGQEKVVSQLKVLNKDILVYNSNYNLLFLGNSGYGKTTLAINFAKSLGKRYSLFTGDKYNINADVVIIDEVHIIKDFEFLYRYMDAGNKTFIFMTTELGMLPEPFINRCIKLQLEEYTDDIMKDIAKSYLPHFNNKMLSIIVSRSRGVPRELVGICKRLIMYIRSDEFYYNANFLESLLDTLGIHEGGFTYMDTQYLKTLEDIGGTASLVTLCSALHQSKETVTKYIEPFLIKKGLIKITSKGRCLC